jgi:hypothetical protein
VSKKNMGWTLLGGPIHPGEERIRLKPGKTALRPGE